MKKTIEKVTCDRCRAEITTKEAPPHVLTEIFISKMGDYCPKCTEDLTTKLAELFDKKIERKTEDATTHESIKRRCLKTKFITPNGVPIFFYYEIPKLADY